VSEMTRRRAPPSSCPRTRRAVRSGPASRAPWSLARRKVPAPLALYHQRLQRRLGQHHSRRLPIYLHQLARLRAG
jgi:hypothetical protein